MRKRELSRWQNGIFVIAAASNQIIDIKKETGFVVALCRKKERARG